MEPAHQQRAACETQEGLQAARCNRLHRVETMNAGLDTMTDNPVMEDESNETDFVEESKVPYTQKKTPTPHDRGSKKGGEQGKMDERNSFKGSPAGQDIYQHNADLS